MRSSTSSLSPSPSLNPEGNTSSFSVTPPAIGSTKQEDIGGSPRTLHSVQAVRASAALLEDSSKEGIRTRRSIEMVTGRKRSWDEFMMSMDAERDLQEAVEAEGDVRTMPYTVERPWSVQNCQTSQTGV